MSGLQLIVILNITTNDSGYFPRSRRPLVVEPIEFTKGRNDRYEVRFIIVIPLGNSHGVEPVPEKM